MNIIKITSWGQSMYGGWYVNYITEDGKVTGKHFDKTTELRKWVKEQGQKLETWRRYDN